MFLKFNVKTWKTFTWWTIDELLLYKYIECELLLFQCVLEKKPSGKEFTALRINAGQHMLNRKNHILDCSSCGSGNCHQFSAPVSVSVSSRIALIRYNNEIAFLWELPATVGCTSTLWAMSQDECWLQCYAVHYRFAVKSRLMLSNQQDCKERGQLTQTRAVTELMQTGRTTAYWCKQSSSQFCCC